MALVGKVLVERGWKQYKELSDSANKNQTFWPMQKNKIDKYSYVNLIFDVPVQKV